MATNTTFGGACPDCGVEPGTLHVSGCDVERCPNCGGQAISCGCSDADFDSAPRQAWTGQWPGDAEAIEFDFWCKWVDGMGWQRTTRDDPDAQPNLSRLMQECLWDKAKGRWVRPTKARA
jgi:hypothetical protein